MVWGDGSLEETSPDSMSEDTSVGVARRNTDWNRIRPVYGLASEV